MLCSWMEPCASMLAMCLATPTIFSSMRALYRLPNVHTLGFMPKQTRGWFRLCNKQNVHYRTESKKKRALKNRKRTRKRALNDRIRNEMGTQRAESETKRALENKNQKRKGHSRTELETTLVKATCRIES